MKNSLYTLICTVFISFALSASSVFAQQSEAPTADVPIGTLIYFEGAVSTGSINDWSDAEINQKLYRTLSIKTGPEASAEVRWNNGLKTVIGPNSEQQLGPLYDNLDPAVKNKSQSIWGEFMALFSEKANEATQEEGGIRRNKATVRQKPGKNELYWKQMREVTFEEASEQYKNGEYKQAVTLLEAFLEQKPKDPRASLMLFALGHSYVELNNLTKAQKVYRQFLNRYPDDIMADKARQFLTLASNE